MDCWSPSVVGGKGSYLRRTRAKCSNSPAGAYNRPFYRYGGHIHYGMPRGTRWVLTRAFRAKRERQCIFLRKKAIVITSKDGTTIFFSHYNLFLGKLKEQLSRKARVNTDASIWDRAHAPWASHNTPYIQLIQYGRRIDKKDHYPGFLSMKHA